MTHNNKPEAQSSRTPEGLLAEVLAAYGQIEDERTRALIGSIIRHLHQFATDTSLTREEWLTGIQFLTAVGQNCTNERQEFILLSDLLGLSSLVEASDYDAQLNETPSSVEGPFYVQGSPAIAFGGTIALDEMGDSEHALIQGAVVDTQGMPIAGATLDIWQTAPNQKYAVHDETQSEFNLRGVQETNAEGRYAFHTVKPIPYPIPTDGPCGELIRKSKRHGMRAAHVHMRVTAPGFQSLTTQIFPTRDAFLDSDMVFGVDQALVVEFCENNDEHSDAELVANYDFVLKRSAGT